MGAKLDLRGNVFGRLTVISEEKERDKNGSVRWKCKCECGNETIVSGNSLKRGKTQSCGCLQIEKSRKNLEGRRFGRLTVVKEIGRSKQGNLLWLCKCDCGKEKSINSKHLLDGGTISCGCAAREISSKMRKRYNSYVVYGDIVFVKFSNTNEYFICDLDDWENLKDFCWTKNKDGYAVNNSKKNMIFHRKVMNQSNKEEVDHIFRVSQGLLDNRKKNLRLCSHSDNTKNSGLQKNNTSGVTGVSKCKKDNKWISRIMVDKKSIYLGSFKKYEDAVNTRLEAEKKYFKEYSPNY